MIQLNQRTLQVLAVSALALGLAACGKKEEPTVSKQLDSAVTQAEQAAADAQQHAAEAAKMAAKKVEEEAAKVGDAASNVASTAMDAAGDAAITAEVKAGLIKDSELSALQINVDTKGATVTLNGVAPNEQARIRAENIAKSAKGVVAVNNLLTIKAP